VQRGAARHQGAPQREPRSLGEVDEGGREVGPHEAAGEHQGVLALAVGGQVDELGEGRLVRAEAGAGAPVAKEGMAARGQAVAAEGIEGEGGRRPQIRAERAVQVRGQALGPRLAPAAQPRTARP
jgi:hypothetical protein